MSEKGKRISEVANELNIPYNKLSYWVKFKFVPFYKANEKSKPRFFPEHIEAIKKYIIYDQENSKSEKTKKTNLDKYGVENVFQSQEIKNKIKDKLIKSYGVDSPLKSEQILNKAKKTCIEKYGVDNPLKNKTIKSKREKTNLEKYGFKNAIQNSEVKEKAKKKFNESIKLDINDNFNLINTLRDNNFWEELKTKSLREICKDKNLNYGSLTYRLLDKEFVDRYYSLYSFPKQQKQKDLFDEISKYVKNISMNDRSIISPLELDIYIPDENFAIEFNGNLWHSEYILPHREAMHKHVDKTNKCKEKGIRLFHIFEYQWDNRKNQILNFIKTILNLNSINIYARKCDIDESVSDTFIENNHIQGCNKKNIKYFNLIHNKEIVASMTASKHHRQNSDSKSIILSRLCFKDNCNIVGGSSKLFKYFKQWAKSEGYDRIISWSDNCWTEGNIYKILDFKLEKEYPPDYFYFNNKNHKVYSKQSQKKNLTKCPKEIKEKDWNEQRGYYRIWNCGKKKWVYIL